MVACSGDNLDTDLASKDKLIAPSSVDIVAGAASQTFEVTANCGWNITAKDSWISVLPMAGNGNMTLTVTPESNSSTDSKSGSITITSNDGVTVVVTVNQAPGMVVLSTSPAEVPFPYTGGNETIQLTCNTEWEATLSSTWLKIKNADDDTSVPSNKLSGSKNMRILVTATENPAADRNATIVFTAKGTGGAVTTFETKVYQRSKNPVIAFQEPSSFDAAGDTKTFGIYSNFGWTASISQGADFAKFIKNDGSEDISITGVAGTDPTVYTPVSLKCEPNGTPAPREIKITARTTEEGVTPIDKSFTVTQDALTPVLTLNLATVQNVSFNGDDITFKVSSNYEWQLALEGTDTRWASLNVTSGAANESKTVSLHVDPNYSTSIRNLTLVMSLPQFENGGIFQNYSYQKQYIEIKQQAGTLPTVSNLAYDESSITKKGATVSFNYASTSFDVETYTLEVATDDSFSTIFSQTTAAVTGSPMTVVLDELTSGTTFYVRVKVHNKVEDNGGDSAWSNVIDFTTKAVPQEEDNDKPGINPVRKR